MRKAIISVTFFNFIAAGLGFLISVLLARIFPVEVFGRINLLLSISTISMTIFEFGYFNSLVIFYNKNKNNDFDQNLLNLITRKYFSFLFKVIPLYGMVLFFINKYYNFDFWELFFLISSALFLVLYRFFTTYYQALGRWDKYNFLNVSYSLLKGIVLLGGGAILILLFRIEANYTLYLKLYILYTLLLFIFGLFASYNLIGIKNTNSYNNKSLKRLILSLGLTNVVIALSMRMDNLIIEYFLGSEQVGIYSAANTLALAFPLITSSIMRVFMKEASKDSLNFLKKILAFQKKYFLHLIAFTSIVILLSPFFIKLIFGSKYIESIPIFQILVFAYIGGIFFTPLESYFYNENSRFVLKVKIIQFLMFICSALILIQIFSLIGIAIAIVLTRIIAWIYFIIKSKAQYAKDVTK